MQSRRALTINCLSDESAKKDDEKWVRGDYPDMYQKKKILAMVIAHGVKIVMSNHVYSVGDKFYLQSHGGPIGLELTGVLAEVMMMSWEKRLLQKLIENEIIVLMLCWYVDDVNSIVQNNSGDDDKVFINKIVAIANTIEDGIEMEVDTIENHQDKKIPILDMKCWLDENGRAYYQHYEKPVSTKLVISSRSAHSNNCKRSVHISEIVRRLCNTSRELDWDKFAAPTVTEYMSRMMQAGYHENYRKHVLLNALAVYDKKVRDDLDGTCPLNRPSGYQKIERRKQKLIKKRNWSTKGGYIAPIIIPSTPGGELAKMLKQVAEAENECGIKFKIIEKGGKTIEKQLQNPNPTASGKCGKADCTIDNQQGGGKLCHKSNVLYEWECNQCDNIYTGETSRNCYTRTKEHLSKASKQSSDSFIKNHQSEKHNDNPADFKVKVVKSFRDPLSRQVYEGIYIRKNSRVSLNTKLDYYQPSTYNMRREMLHG